MAKNVDTAIRILELLRKSLIVQLGLAGVAQAQIRTIVGGSMNDINAIVKLLHSGKRSKKNNGS